MNTIGAVVVVLGVLVAVTTQLLHVSIAMLIGAMLMVLTRVIDMDETYHSIQWKSVFLIAGMLPISDNRKLSFRWHQFLIYGFNIK